MRYWVASLVVLVLSGSAWAQSSFYHDYKSFFGKEDRVGLFSEKAKAQFSETVRKSIAVNTLLVDCGSQGRPATGFIANTEDGPRIFTAAHNVEMAEENSRPCYIRRLEEADLVIDNFKPSQNFRNSATLLDAGFDLATSDTKLSSGGFEMCQSLDMNSKLLVPQSFDGTGYLTLAPQCRATKITNHIITTTCRGHYKASGAPLLVTQDDKVCVAGVFNAHSGSLMNYESYAARLNSGISNRSNQP